MSQPRTIRRYAVAWHWSPRRWHLGLFRGHADQAPRPRATIIVGPLRLHVYEWQVPA